MLNKNLHWPEYSPREFNGQIIWSYWQSFSNLVHSYPKTAIGLSFILSFTCIVPIATIVASLKSSPESKLNNLMNQIDNLESSNINPNILAKNIDELVFDLNNETVKKYVEREFKLLKESKNNFKTTEDIRGEYVIKSREEELYHPFYDRHIINLPRSDPFKEYKIKLHNMDKFNIAYNIVKLNSEVLQSIKPKWAATNFELDNKLFTTLLVNTYPEVLPAQHGRYTFTNVISKDVSGLNICYSSLGNSFANSAGISNKTKRVLDATLVTQSLDNKIIYGAIAQGCDHSNDNTINEKIAHAALGAVISAVNKSADKPDKMTSIEFVNQINDEVFKSFYKNEKHRGQAHLCYYRSELNKNGKLNVTAVSIGNCILIAYSPSNKEWTTIISPSPQLNSNACIGGITYNKNGGVINRSYLRKEIISNIKILDKDSIIIAMTEGRHIYLPWKKNGLRKSLDFEKINDALKSVLQSSENSETLSKDILRELGRLALSNQHKIINDNKSSNLINNNCNDDFASHVVQPSVMYEARGI